MKSFRCTFGPVTETDFVWPPPPADLEGCSEVRLSEEFVQPPQPADVEGCPADVEGCSVVRLSEEFVWPPPPADFEGCSVVRLSEEEDASGQPVSVTIEDFRPHMNELGHTDVELDADAPTQEIPIPPAVLARLAIKPERAPEPPPGADAANHFEPPPLIPLLPDEPELEDEPDEELPVFAFAPPGPEPPPESTTPRGNGFAWAAVFFAISCGTVAYSEFRSGRREALQVVHATDVTPASETAGPPPSPEPEPVVTFEREPAVPAARPAPAPPRPREAKPEPEPEPEPEVQPRVTLRAASLTSPRPAPALPSRLATPAPSPAPVVRTAAATPASTRETTPAAAPTTLALATPPPAAAEPVLHAAVLDPVAEEAAGSADEAHIESTLTRFRTAYSQLDARAAREVWPSVDVEALDRAFRGLKSQDLRFDRCDLTVDGQRARAACRGRAVYVPRVGNQSPKATPREWTFELLKSDQRWTIASARSS
jgi:hypothetical protein